MAMVTKSPPVLVVPPPSSLTVDDAVSLTSSLDRSVIPFSVTSVLLFDRPIPTPADTIKAALSSALAHYRPVAGRLAGADDDDNQILRIEGAAGVPFVAASATCALADVTTALLGELVLQYPGDFCRHEDPLLMVQVTEFACGGFAVAATWNHVLTDGFGMAQFLGAVGELARGAGALTPSVAPVRSDDGSLPRLPASKVAAQKLTMSLVPNTDFLLIDLAVPSTLIARVKAEFNQQPPCTVFEAVAAVLWRCRTRVVSGAGHGAMVTLSFPSNVRGLVGARRGYYGNCVVVQTLRAPRGTVADGDIAGVVRMIRRAKERIPDLLLMDESSNGVAVSEGGAEEDQSGMERPYNTFVVSSWRNLGFEAVEFGGGTPARVMWHGEHTVVPGCVVCPPEKDGNGVKVVSLCVRPEHADAFQAELAREAGVVAK